ncbi:hypothetical protein GGX14DRAFT_396040 [Mycena pura]|uniref:Uncharacterized protein n=1 Tax=Mycena pura TaxID=153505 RepID=A0AAD6VER6_9AGAR|nr:hypothetical protein GGX14DRAFT_396040 [Mycena pura]
MTSAGPPESKSGETDRILQWSHWQMQASANHFVPADWIGVSKVMIGTSRPMSRQCSGSIHPSQEATQGAQPHVTQNEAGLSPMGRSASAGRRSVENNKNPTSLGPSASRQGAAQPPQNCSGNLGRNLFQHISLAHPAAAGRDGLALFTHAPISELVYLLTGASVSASGTEGLYGLNGGENGWELWNRLCHEELLKVMKVGGELGAEYSYNADDYEKPVEGSKKRQANHRAAW